ncbi:MAG: hypothetical protein ACI9KN_002508, partial [Gammaproteobacteria bacterium]
GHDASPILRRGKMPHNIEDGTMSIYINGLKDGARYRESGLVPGHKPGVPFHFSNDCFLKEVWQIQKYVMDFTVDPGLAIELE